MGSLRRFVLVKPIQTNVSVSLKLTIFALILASLLSSCVSYSNPDFGGFREVEITELVKSEVAIEKNHTASSQNKPILGKFTFRFRIIDPKGAFSSITVTRMTAQYKNGDVQTMTKPWTKTFAESRKRRGADSPMHLNVETLLFRHENVTVRFDDTPVLREAFFRLEPGDRDVARCR